MQVGLPRQNTSLLMARIRKMAFKNQCYQDPACKTFGFPLDFCKKHKLSVTHSKEPPPTTQAKVLT